MATLLVIATSGDLAGSIQRVEQLNLNAYDQPNDVAEFCERLRKMIYDATQLEAASAEVKQLRPGDPGFGEDEPTS